MLRELFIKGYIKLRNTLNNESGQAMTEYGLIIALIAVVVIGVVSTLGTKLNGAFKSIVDAFPTSSN